MVLRLKRGVDLGRQSWSDSFKQVHRGAHLVGPYAAAFRRQSDIREALVGEEASEDFE